MSNHTSGLFLAIIGTFLFALKSIFIKLAYTEGASTDEVLVLRMLLASPFYIGMLFYLRKNKSQKTQTISDTPSNKRPSAKNTIKIISLGFIGYYLASYLDLKGLTMISAQLERLTLFTYPTMIAVLAAFFLREKITPKIIISLILCYLGLWIMYSQELILTEPSNNDNVTIGVSLVLGSALCYSIYVILAKPLIIKFGSRYFTSLAMLGSTLFVIIHFSITSSFHLGNVNSTIWIYALLLAFVCTVIPSFMINEAISRIGASKASILGGVGPVFTIILAVFVINEPFTIYHGVGVIMVLAGVACVSMNKK